MPWGDCACLVQNMPNTRGGTLILLQPSGGPVSGPGPPQAFLSSPSAGPGEPKAGASRRAVFQGVGGGGGGARGKVGKGRLGGARSSPQEVTEQNCGLLQVFDCACWGRECLKPFQKLGEAQRRGDLILCGEGGFQRRPRH